MFKKIKEILGMKVMRHIISFLIGTAVLLVIAIAVLLVLAATPMQPIDAPDLYGYKDRAPRPEVEVEVRRYPARDGAQLAYRFYDSSAETILIFVHGSSGHGASHDVLATQISQAGVAKVYLPNMRGHYLSGRRRGDIDYIEQLEDDIADLISFARESGHEGPIVLGGFSSGGGFAIRFAGGEHGHLASAYMLLSPIIPTAPTVKPANADWAHMNQRRLIGLVGLNFLGIHGFDGLPTLQFNKPEAYWDGVETLAYSHRLATGMSPRLPGYESDISSMRGPVLVMAGDEDQSNDAHAFRDLFAEYSPQAEVVVLPGIDHFGINTDAAALSRMEAWLVSLDLPASPAP